MNDKSAGYRTSPHINQSYRRSVSAEMLTVSGHCSCNRSSHQAVDSQEAWTPTSYTSGGVLDRMYSDADMRSTCAEARGM